MPHFQGSSSEKCQLLSGQYEGCPLFLSILIVLFLFSSHAYSGTFTIQDSWIDWPGYTSNHSTQDEWGTPKIDSMVVTWDNDNLLERVDIILSAPGWQEFNSLFINTYSLSANGGSWDDWDYFVHDGGNTNDNGTVGNVPGNGIFSVNDSYTYTFSSDPDPTKPRPNNIRAASPNGIDSDSLGQGLVGTTGWTLTDTNTYSFNFKQFTGLEIDMSDGFFMAFAPYCSNDVIGGGYPGSRALNHNFARLWHTWFGPHCEKKSIQIV